MELQKTKEYKYEAGSLVGFVQQLASNILPHGYWFYCMGVVPDDKCLDRVDRKLLSKYQIAISRQQRARRKATGQANLHYLRLGRVWILLATHGRHEFFERESKNIRDCRKVPIQVGGYSISVKQGGVLRKIDEQRPVTSDPKMRVRVQISRERFREILYYFQEIACRQTSESLGRELYNIPFEPYAPVRRQLLTVVRKVNERRELVGLDKLPYSVLRYQRHIVKPFESGT